MTLERIGTGSKRVRKRFNRAAKERIACVASLAAKYYREQGRTFPWREERDAFRLAVAEVLLQKTRAKNVIDTYVELLRRYPSARDLSQADVSDLEGLLRPLGLSRKRSTQLIGMATVVTRRGPGVLEDWRTLLADVPGIGAYAARAIACFSKGERLGIVDANTARIERRVFGLRQTDTRAVVFQQYADEIAAVSNDVIGTNFGLLDLGALVCLPTPRCSICPLDAICMKCGVKRKPRRASTASPRE